jgi:hypothetical protein
MVDTFNDTNWNQTGRTNHGGYCLNTSTNDSWHEGWANYYAALVQKEILKSSKYWRLQDGPGLYTDLESQYKSWHSEEIAVAGLLLDLIDQTSDYPAKEDDDAITLDLKTLWAILSKKDASQQAESGGFIFDMVDLYENLKAAQVGQGDLDKNQIRDLDDVFIQHGFYELDNPKLKDTSFKPPKRIAFTGHLEYLQGGDKEVKKVVCPAMKERRTSPPLPGSYIALDVSNLPADTRFQGELVYAGRDTGRSFSFTFTKNDIPDGRIYLMLPPPESPAVLRISPAGQAAAAQKPLEIDSAAFWAKVPDASDRPLLSAAIQAPAQPSSWVLGFTVAGLLLCLTILILGLRRRKPSATYDPYRSYR